MIKICKISRSMAEKHLKQLKLITSALCIGFRPLCRWTLIHLFVLSGFPSPLLQKMQDICELSSETSSSLKVCLSLFSRREGVSLNILHLVFFFHLLMHAFAALTTSHEFTRMALKMYCGFMTPMWFVQQTVRIGENRHRMSCGWLQVQCSGVTDSSEHLFANLKWWENELVKSHTDRSMLFLPQLLSPFAELLLTCSIVHFHAHLQTGFSCARSKVNVWRRFLCRAAVVSAVYFFFPSSSSSFFSWIRFTVKSQQKANAVSPWIGRASKGIRRTVLDDGIASKVEHPNFFTCWFTSSASFVCIWGRGDGGVAICAELKGPQILDWASFHHNLNKKSDATIESSLIHPHLLAAELRFTDVL